MQNILFVFMQLFSDKHKLKMTNEKFSGKKS